MYPSDYGYATSGGSTKDRATCLSGDGPYSWTGSIKDDCVANDWLYTRISSEWTITPHNWDSNVYRIHGNTASLTHDWARYTDLVYPVAYLNSNLIIKNKTDGSNTSPFTLKG